MTAWRAKYAAVAIYIGGQEMGCDYGNLSKSWVQAAEGMGWSLMPTYVGPQAPCNSFSDEINPNQAASEGQQAASQAITDAGSFGLGQGSPIYYDMEAYNETDASCVTAVLTFLDAWDRQLQASGYVSGVYSSAGSGITDLQDHEQHRRPPAGRAAGDLDRAVGQRGEPDRVALHHLRGMADLGPVQAVRRPAHGDRRRDLTGHRLRPGQRCGGAGVTAGRPAAPGQSSSRSRPSALKLGASGHGCRRACQAAPAPGPPRGSRPSRPPTASRMETTDGLAQ